MSFSISYDNKNLNVMDTNSNVKHLNLTYIIIPIKYQRFLLSLGADSQFRTSFLIGPIVSFHISQSPNNILEKLPWINVGLLLGTKFEYDLNPNLSIFLDYSFQFGMVNIQSEREGSRIISNNINLGFKVPTNTIF